MSVTALGSVFLPLAFFALLFRRDWLLPLLCVAAVLQSPSVIDVEFNGSSFGLTPFLAVTAIIAVDLLFRAFRTRSLGLGFHAQRRLLLLWSTFCVVAIVGSAVLPSIFAGADVMAPLAAGGVDAHPVPLMASVSNAAQLLNLLLISAVSIWLLQRQHDPSLPRQMLLGVLAAVAVAVVIGLQQRLAWNGLVPMWEGFWASNPGYSQNYRTWAGPVPRVSWPFVEASYASAWFAAVLGGFVTMFLANVKRHAALFGALVAAFALGNTLGATGLLAAGVFSLLALAMVLVLAIAKPQLRGGLGYRLSLAGLVAACVSLAAFLVVRHYGMVEMAGLAAINVWEGRSQTVLGDIRPHADLHALGLLRDTWGLGVGMGSNRASSYLATLASNTGIAGLLLFLTAMTYQCVLLLRHAWQKPTAPTLFFLGSGVAGLIAVSIAIPDQNWPVFWLLIIGGIVCLGGERDSGSEATAVPQPAGHVELGDRSV